MKTNGLSSSEANKTRQHVKFSECYEARIVIILNLSLTNAFHIPSTLFQYYLPSTSSLLLVSFLQIFLAKSCINFHVCAMPSSSYLFRFGHCNNIWRQVQVMKPLIVKSSASSLENSPSWVMTSLRRISQACQFLRIRPSGFHIIGFRNYVIFTE